MAKAIPSKPVEPEAPRHPVPPEDPERPFRKHETDKPDRDTDIPEKPGPPLNDPDYPHGA